MRRTAIKVLEELIEGPKRIRKLSDILDKSNSWISEVTSDLEDKNLVEKNDVIRLSDSYEGVLLSKIYDKYTLEKVLLGKREETLLSLTSRPRSIEELGKKGFSTSTLYDSLKDLKEVGVVKKDKHGRYVLTDEDVKTFVEIIDSGPFQDVYRVHGEKVIRSSKKIEEGISTGFSAFQRYGVEYYPSKFYRYLGGETLAREDVLIHSLLTADDKKQTAICCIFYLKHRKDLDMETLWSLSDRWDIENLFADMLAYIDGREVLNGDMFLPRDEFNRYLDDYDIKMGKKYRVNKFEKEISRFADNIDKSITIYLVGGVNLILRNLKDSTKDIDVVFDDRNKMGELIKALHRLEYSEDVGSVKYDRLRPDAVLKRKGSPRWDVFLGDVAGLLIFTESMKDRSELYKIYGDLSVRLVSLTDMFLFKSVTEREGDLEDAAVIVKRGALDWEKIIEEIRVQEKKTGRYISFIVLQTLDILKDRYGLDTPIRDKLESYSLKSSLRYLLKEPSTIEDIRKKVDFPDNKIYNKLRKLESEGKIKVDRTGRLNTYEWS